MTIAFNVLNDVLLGYAAIFICIGFGFISLKIVYPRLAGPLYWPFSFFSNSLGFIFWSGLFSLEPVIYYFLGEIFHIAGFFLLVHGAIRFSKIRVTWKWLMLLIGIWLAIWFASILSIQKDFIISGITLKLLRALIYLAGGSLLLLKKIKNDSIGKYIAGTSLLLWAAFVIVSAFVSMNRNVFYGFLVGFHVLVAFGMVAMVVDRIRNEIEAVEKHVRQLEGILPICSYCKKIRDEKNEWYRMEEYIEDRSKAEFSHGICPECFEKHRPDK